MTLLCNYMLIGIIVLQLGLPQPTYVWVKTGTMIGDGYTTREG